MRLTFITGMFFFSASVLTGQVRQTSRYEADIKTNDPEPMVFSMEETGLLIAEDSRDFENGKRIRKYIHLDTALQIVWAAKASIPEEEEIAGYEYSAGRFQLLYTHRQHQFLKGSVVTLNIYEQTLRSSPFNVQLNMKLTHFTSAGKNSVIGGQMGLQPVIVLFEVETSRTRILPGFFLNDSELIDLRVNKNETFSLIQLNRKGREKVMIYRAFDQDGNQLVEDRFELDPEITIQSATSSTLVHNEVMIAGIYSFGNSRLSTGVFSVILNPGGEKLVRYTDFPMLSHFLDYLPEKKAARIIEKASRRRSFGRSPDFRIAATLHRVDEHPFGFLVFGESFQIPSETQNSMMNTGPFFYRPGLSTIPYQYNNLPWRYGYDPFTGTDRVNSTVRMANAFAVAFGFNGSYLWDQAVDLDQISIPPDVQFADYVLSKKGNTEFFFPSEKGLGHSVSGGESGKKEVVYQSVDVGKYASLNYENSLEHTLRRWHGNNLFISGQQITRDGSTRESDQRRKVFFINKIELK
ncbi:MAG: hypothetical protein ACO3FI_05850 [Cyclobacteriaceae bacterium]